MARRSAEADPPSVRTTQRRSDRFLSGLRFAERVTFVSHVQPDPDSLGSMMGLACLVQDKLGLPTRLTRDGPISRAENRAMVDLLNLELQPVESLTFTPSDAVVMVDSQPNTGRHSLPSGLVPYAVIDHHQTPGDLSGVKFADIRTSVGATCTLVTRYLLEQSVNIPAEVATGLMYGIETELCGYPREAGPIDEEALDALFPLADRDLLAQIRNVRLPHSHFECLLQALQSSFIYDRLIISWVYDLPHPEHAAQVAEFMIRFEEVDWALCAGVYKNDLILSLRTALRNANAGEILRTVVNGMGRAGGHDRRAGGCIPLTSNTSRHVEEIQSELRRRFLKALCIEECRGQRLVRLREMLQHIRIVNYERNESLR